ncbi:MAG: SGNH/GDSL hydrolase family protein [Deltaproteobacteria bacterium]|nr:SGNH/GDSL hydrolase family protein [Deltaproteobacteria bacterium]
MNVRLLTTIFASWMVACSGGSDGGSSQPSGAGSGTTDGGTQASKRAFRTHVILGDSISDRGGAGPFYYDLLDKNDDAKWPDGAGKDLATLYGPDLAIVKASRAGARAQNLGGQVNTITGPLAGPVLVTMTIGGNDVQAALGKMLTGGDVTAERESFREFLDEAIGMLKQPDRFGPGVEVVVYVANVYDPSDGTGNFKFASGARCGGALGFYPAGQPTAPQLDPFEQIYLDVAAKYDDVHVLDLRAKFNGHGVPAADTWFVSDCLHPNAPGHDALRDLFWEAITK